jgi:hypothetical protein
VIWRRGYPEEKFIEKYQTKEKWRIYDKGVDAARANWKNLGGPRAGTRGVPKSDLAIGKFTESDVETVNLW